MYLVKENLTIRSAAVSDAEILTAWWNDGAVMAHAGFPNGLGQSVEETVRQIRENETRLSQRCIIEVDGLPVGEMAFGLKDGGAAEIGIKICDPAYQNRGYGSELLRMLLRYLFEDRELNEAFPIRKVVLDTNLKNIRAQHVYERLGFTRLRVNYRSWQDQLGDWQDSVDYEMTAEDYRRLSDGKMKPRKIKIAGIPALIWGEKSEKAYLYVHGKQSNKESAEKFAEIAAGKGFQTISFDLPQHGERKGEDARCDIWNGIRDLTAVGEYVLAAWKEVSLYACSLGAFFSLHAYPEYRFRKCLFQSPVLDMEYLIERMMIWFDISPERLMREKEIETPVDTLSWDYWQYVKAHPIPKWEPQTSILYGGKDTLQSRGIMEDFIRNGHGTLTVAENSDHPFMAKGDEAIVLQWLLENI